MQTMRAIEYHAPGDIRVCSVAMPCCADDEIRAKVDACAICGTDLKTYVHGNPRIKPPKIMGHEFTAVVETVVELISTAQVPAEKIATHILPLEEIFKGFDLMKSGQALRVVLKP